MSAGQDLPILSDWIVKVLSSFVGFDWNTIFTNFSLQHFFFHNIGTFLWQKYIDAHEFYLCTCHMLPRWWGASRKTSSCWFILARFRLKILWLILCFHDLVGLLWCIQLLRDHAQTTMRTSNFTPTDGSEHATLLVVSSRQEIVDLSCISNFSI